MKTPGILALLLLCFFIPGRAEKYWISFSDKANVVFDPYAYFSERTIMQRLSQNISLRDSTDFPVNSDYVEAIKKIADSVSWPSRWLNGMAAYCNEEEISKIAALPFVSNTQKMFAQDHTCMLENATPKLSKYDSTLIHYQINRLQGDSFARHGYDGTGIRIAVLDAGFPGVDKLPAFSHLREGNKIISTYDFVCRKENVYKNHWHGTATLSCITGKTTATNIGMATGAEFLLARTEKGWIEAFSEEENWLAAAEWADRQGANIISSSLGYTDRKYFNYQMDGHSSLVAHAATIAASKGILVVNAAGNEGHNSWHHLVTPADADSVLTVGGTDPDNDYHIMFSSFGPSGNGKLKPNVCAPASVVAIARGKLSRVAGTSFSTPLVAGFAACAWQVNRKLNNMELFDAIEKSSHLYPYFDYAHGFGIPQATWFISKKPEAEATFDFVIINNEIKVVLREQYSYVDAEEALGFHTRRNFYYKIEDKTGAIKNYRVLLAEKKEMLHFYTEDFQPGDVITVHFEGYTSSLDFPDDKQFEK